MGTRIVIQIFFEDTVKPAVYINISEKFPEKFNEFVRLGSVSRAHTGYLGFLSNAGPGGRSG